MNSPWIEGTMIALSVIMIVAFMASAWAMRAYCQTTTARS